MSISQAIAFAAKAHDKQLRKGTDIPYIAHPLAVGMLLAQAGCSDEVVTAGILHDTLEDTSVTVQELRREFGAQVTDLVVGASEPAALELAPSAKKISWEKRKEHTINYLKNAPTEVRLVALADKLHNVRSMAEEHRRVGDALWERFHRGKEKQAWYYRSLLESLAPRDGAEAEQRLYEPFSAEVRNLFVASPGTP